MRVSLFLFLQLSPSLFLPRPSVVISNINICTSGRARPAKARNATGVTGGASINSAPRDFTRTRTYRANLPSEIRVPTARRVRNRRAMKNRRPTGRANRRRSFSARDREWRRLRRGGKNGFNATEMIPLISRNDIVPLPLPPGTARRTDEPL